MPELTIGWEYLTGYATATDPSRRERAEWPPHPGRVFMAMAAAWFETGEDAAEGAALGWLERLGEPELRLPPKAHVFERSSVTAYVPVNDKAGPSRAALPSVPAMTRSRQPRTFPRVHVGDAPCFLHWLRAEDVDSHREALDRLCARVTRIGHASSLVRMWVAAGHEPQDAACERWEPADATATDHCRIVTAGTRAALPGQTQVLRIEAHAALRMRIEDAERERVEARCRQDQAAQSAADLALRQAKAEYTQLFGEKWKKSAAPPALLRPRLGLWSGYRRVASVQAGAEVPATRFDTDLLVLRRIDGPVLPVVSTLAVTRTLRGAVMQHSAIQPVPEWVSGHQANGERSEAESGHLACVPLPFVGVPHADGHLLGVGLVFPRSVDRRERGRVLGPLLLEGDGQPRDVTLKLGRLGVWTLQKCDWSERRSTLQPETWTAHPAGETTWASVTPVVLDRFPRVDRAKDRAGWTDEVAAIIAGACRRIGLPEPASVDIDTTCWQRGSPRAVGKRRLLRGHPELTGGDAALGDGFPFYPPRGSGAPRPQVHVHLRFAGRIVGPVLIGAGRYQGYGLCRPMNRGGEVNR